MARINLCLGAKGGIGKSFIAALLGQYLTDARPKRPPLCIDLDFKTTTFAKYKGLNVKLIDVETDGDIERRKFDVFVNHIAEAGKGDALVVDTGGNIYLTLMHYMLSNGVPDYIHEMGHELLLHVPIMGGQELGETMETLEEVIGAMPPTVLIAVWINQFNGVVERNGKNFEQSDLYNAHRERIRNICYIPKWRDDMQRDVSEMLKERVTFDVGIGMGRFGIMEKQRLKMAKRYLYQAVDLAKVCV